MHTYRFAILGDPVEHSRSPELHRAMLDLAGLEGEYLKIRADADVLRSTLQELRAGQWSGLNVTMPLKTEGASQADTLSPWAAKAGSVNTLVVDESAVHGDTTDATAFHQLLNSDAFEEAPSVHILGAGGSASAALAAMPDNRHVYVSARRPARAQQLADSLGGDVAPWGAAVAGALVINTTPLGMSGESLPQAVLEVSSGLIDLPYASEKTPAIVWAEARGIPHIDGHHFLARQAIASFGLWTGVDVDPGELTAYLRKP